MKPKIVPLLEHCVQEGVLSGYSKAFKNDNNPSEEHITTCIQNSIMIQIYEHFEFNES